MVSRNKCRTLFLFFLNKDRKNIHAPKTLAYGEYSNDILYFIYSRFTSNDTIIAIKNRKLFFFKPYNQQIDYFCRMKPEDLENIKQQKWNSVNEYLAKAGSRLNILEEEIDIEVQHEFMDTLEMLMKDKKQFKTMSEESASLVDKLYDQNVNESVKKKLLVVLATINQIAIYRQIEAFQKEDTPLKKYATVALQQSRMLIQSSLLDESTVFVSTGLGGHGTHQDRKSVV